MSALTDLFSALATKIRAKTGGSDTYTPPEMVDAIDDVYDAGVAAGETVHTQTYTPATNTAANDMGSKHSYRYVNTSGMITPSGNKSITANGTGIDVSSYATASVNVSGTSITPSNSSPASMSSGGLYTPSAAGYAISSYSSVTPSNSSPVTLSSGSIYKMGGAGKAVASVTSVTPSNSSPATLTSGTVYKPSASGVAITSYTSITPSSTSQSVSSGGIYKMGGNGVVVSSVPTITDITPSNSSPVSMSANSNYKPTASGYAISSYSSVTPSSSGTSFSSGMVKMDGGGYAYSSRPSVSETTLWTNSSPGSDFASKTVTLSDSLSNYEYLKFVYRFKKSNTTTVCGIFKTSDLINYSTGSDNCMRPVIGARNTYNYGRIIKYISATQLSIADALCIGGSSTSNSSTIPVNIIGMNF